MLDVILPSIVMLTYSYTEIPYAGCHSTECPFLECRGANLNGRLMMIIGND
jgi:hypothetical protein